MIDRRIVKYKLRRGTEAQRQLVKFDEGELVYIVDTKRVFIGDGMTIGGNLISNKVTNSSTPPDAANRTPGDLLYRPDLQKFYIADSTQWNYVGPAPDTTSIDFDASNTLGIVSGGVRLTNLNSNIVAPNSGVGLGLSGLFVNYDPATMVINGSGQLKVVGAGPVDPNGGLVATINGVAVNTDGTTLIVEPAINGNYVHVGTISAQHITDGCVSYAKLGAGVIQLSGGLKATGTGYAVDFNSSTLQLSAGQLTVNSSIIPAVQNVPSGTIIHTACSAVPAGYLAADGSAVSRTTYATLFAAIGELFGAGDSSTTFNLPDLRGYFVRSFGTNSDSTASGAIGQRQADDLKSHTHTINLIQGQLKSNASTATKEGVWGSGSTGATGGTETRPKNIALLACIKT